MTQTKALADTANPGTFIEGRPDKAGGWRSIRRCTVADGVLVDLWLAYGSSARGWGDSYGVPDAWRQDGKWVHTYRGRVEELASHYITHWRPKPT